MSRSSDQDNIWDWDKRGTCTRIARGAVRTRVTVRPGYGSPERLTDVRHTQGSESNIRISLRLTPG